MNNYEFCAREAARLAPDAAARILDYGCGAGQIVDLLRSGGREAWGCDIFYEGTGYGDEIRPERLVARNIKPMPDGTIPFPSDHFEVVTANQVIEHVENLDAVLAEIHRVLRPGGFLLTLFPHRGVWREAHVGVPFLHRFPKGAAWRVPYTASFRLLGLGRNIHGRRPLPWARDMCDWVDRFTFYRSREEIRRSFDRVFTEFTHHESRWLDTRFGGRFPWVLPLPVPFKQIVVRCWAGLIIICRKPLIPASAGP